VDNADALRQVIERGFGRGDLSVADDFAGETITEHEYEYEYEYDAPGGRDGPPLLRTMISDARTNLVDLTMTVADLVVDGDKVWARSVGHCTDPNTGRRLTFTVFDLCRFSDGRIVEHWGVPDRYAVSHQATPVTPQAD